MLPSEALGGFSASERGLIGLAIYGLAAELSRLSEHQVAALGLVIAGEASGWMGPDEVPTEPTLEDVERLAAVLFERLAAGTEWERQLGGEPGG